MCDCDAKSEAGRYFGKIGGQVGDLVTYKVQSAIQEGQKRFKAWSGLGDYKIHSNSLISGGNGRGDVIVETRGRSTFIRWREYLGDVTTHPETIGGFNPTTFVVNPANLHTFPWLSTIATQFDQYKPLGIIFEFKSTATDTTTNASLGSVIFATEYDILDGAYANKNEMVNSAYSSESKMTEDVLHGIECDPAELNRKIFFTRTSTPNQAVAGDRDYDVCKTTVATQGGGLSVGQSVGSLYVHYEFEFVKEQVYGGIPALNQLEAGFISTIAATVPRMQNFGFVRRTGYDFGLTFANDAIVFPRMWAGATFRIRFTYSQTDSFTMGPASAWLYVNCSRSLPNPALQNGGGGWATYMSPFNGEVMTAPAVSSGETEVRLNDVLSIPAQLVVSSLSAWGMIPTTMGPGMICCFTISLINRNWNISI